MHFIRSFWQQVDPSLLLHQPQESGKQAIGLQGLSRTEDDELLLRTREGDVYSSPISEQIPNLVIKLVSTAIARQGQGGDL